MGIFAFVRPREVFTAILVFSALAILAGILAVAHAVRLPKDHAAGRWWLLLEGVAGIALGALGFEFVRKTLFLAYTLGTWAIVIGVAILGFAIVLRKMTPLTWLWGIAGLAVAVVGFAVVLDPLAVTLGPSFILGTVASAVGVAHLIVGISAAGRPALTAGTQPPALP